MSTVTIKIRSGLGLGFVGIGILVLENMSTAFFSTPKESFCY